MITIKVIGGQKQTVEQKGHYCHMVKRTRQFSIKKSKTIFRMWKRKNLKSLVHIRLSKKIMDELRNEVRKQDIISQMDIFYAVALCMKLVFYFRASEVMI